MQALHFFVGRCRVAGSVDAASAWPGFGDPYFTDGESAWCRFRGLDSADSGSAGRRCRVLDCADGESAGHRSRVADSAHGASAGRRRRLDAAVIGPRVGLLLTPARLSSRAHGLKWPKSNSNVQYSWSLKKKRSGQRRRKSGGGGKRAVPGRAISTLPPRRGGAPTAFFRRHVVVLLCGWDVAARRGRGRPSVARESQLFGMGGITKIFSKDPFGRHYHDVSVLCSKDAAINP